MKSLMTNKVLFNGFVKFNNKSNPLAIGLYYFIKTAFILLLFISTGSMAQTFNPNYLDGRVMFKLKDNVPIESYDFISKLPLKSEPQYIDDINKYAKIKHILSNYSYKKLERPSYYTKNSQLMRIFRVYFSNYSEIDNIINDLQAMDIVEYAEKEPIYKTSLLPNDPLYSQSTNKWYLSQVNAEQAWDISTGSNNIKLAIVDNAIFCGHTDLTTYKQRDVSDVDDDATPPETYSQDPTWSHGTHCSGLATADINNGIGMPSLGGNVELIAVKITPDDGVSSGIYNSYDGMQWACQNGSNVISMSFGGEGYSNSTQILINNYPNIVFIAAAGNDGTTTKQYPGAYNNVICVGSVDSDDSRSYFSNYNGVTQWVDIAAPGGYSNGGLLSSIYTTGGNNYVRMGGTSMATPFAAGLVGLMLSVNPTLSPQDVLSCLQNSGENINQNIGPRINAYGALQCVQATMTGNPYANFNANKTTIIVGDSIIFSDISNNGGNPITNWQWTFAGGNPSSYTGQTPPAITYDTVGVYSVELIVTNSQNSDTVVKSSYITVTMPPYGNWIKQATCFSAVSRGINYISIVDSNIVWATAYDGTGQAIIQEFSKTTDGGSTWTPGTINIGNASLGISLIHAYNEDTAWLAAYPNAAGQTGGVWKTTDGGSTWTRQTSALFNNPSSFTNVIYFWDANNGFCMGDPINGEFEIYTTTDGGTNWIATPGANIPNPLSADEYGYVRKFEVVGDVVWFTTSNGRIYKSTNRGLNFVVYQSPISDFTGNLSFKDENNGLIVDNNSTVYRSTDGGSTWTTVSATGPINTIGLCWIEKTDTIFSTGEGSSYSSDGGISWNLIDDVQHLEVEFITPSLGWSGYFSDSPATQGIWKWQNASNLIVDFLAIPDNTCAGDSIVFSDLTTGGTPTSWSWTFPGGTPSASNQQSPSVTYNTPGIYNVTLTVNDGNSPATHTIYNCVTINGAPPQPSVISGNALPCEGSIVVYSVTQVFETNYSWTLPSGWSGTSTTDSIYVTVGTGTGTISVTPSNSCDTGISRTLNVTAVIPPVANYTYVDNLGVVTFTNSSSPDGSSFYWNFDDGGTSTLENPTHTYTAVGDYDVAFIVTNSCTSDTITQTINIPNLGIDEHSNLFVDVFPNPANNILNIKNLHGTNELEIYNVLGEKFYSRTLKTVDSQINISGLNEGLYFLAIISGNGERRNIKFVKQ